MRKSFKKEQITLLIRESIELYLTQNLEIYGFSRVVDVNMAEDLKTAYIYIACPVEKQIEKLENRITQENRKIVEIFKERFESKFIPKLKYIFIKEEDVKF
jgi:ribosome-binding factor A